MSLSQYRPIPRVNPAPAYQPLRELTSCPNKSCPKQSTCSDNVIECLICEAITRSGHTCHYIAKAQTCPGCKEGKPLPSM